MNRFDGLDWQFFSPYVYQKWHGTINQLITGFFPKQISFANDEAQAREHSFTSKGEVSLYLPFYLFKFNCFAHVELTTYLLIWLNPNQSNRYVDTNGSSVKCKGRLRAVLEREIFRSGDFNFANLLPPNDGHYLFFWRPAEIKFNYFS